MTQNNAKARARKEASREPLTDENKVTYSDGVKGHANTPGHVHSLAQGAVEITITEGYNVYEEWCAEHGVEPLAGRID